MINDVTFWNYGNYSSSNYGAHTMAFRDAQGNRYWFSYETLVAFRIGGEFHIVKNYWGPTTGKHLNWIDDRKEIRETREEFEKNFERLTESKKGEND